MAELTLEAAQKLVDSIDEKGRARDAKGRYVAEEQVKIAKELIQQNKKTLESNSSGFKNVVDATREANKSFEQITNLQSALKDEQSTKIYRIYSYQITQNTLEEEDYQDGKHELSIELIQKEQLKHCIEVANLQKQIDKNPFKKSVEIMRKNSNEQMLSRKYDRLFKKIKE